jgi:hypothetical protein
MRFDRVPYYSVSRATGWGVGAALILLAFSSGVQAQDAIAPTATSATIYQAASETQSTPAPLSPTPDSNLRSADVAENEVTAQPRRFQYGLQITLRGVYDDNINISNTNRVSDYYFTIEPVLTLGAGDIKQRVGGQQDNYIRLDYAPALVFFADHSEDDAVQHVIRVGGLHQFARLTLTLGEEIAILDGTDLRSIADHTAPGSHANIDVSGRTRFQTYNTQLNASYDLSGKTFLSSGVNSLVTHYDSSSLFSSAMISGNLFINYHYSDKTVVGIGGTGGYDIVDQPNPNQTFEQANARLSYQATDKISFNLSGGVEFRQFDHNSRGQYISPVFELSASYQPSDATSITLSGSRRTNNSGVLAAQDYAATIVDFGLRQRFLQRFYVGVNTGYQNSDYFSTVNGVSATRQDNYYFIEPSLDFSITRFWTFGGYYLHRQNDSSTESFRFNDNQVGARTGLIF